uniref:Pyroglutamylated RFamide peptide receptor n=1 Tax=Myotis myotis TaxID=51298 RepID=A0A7J7XKQ6_MYOMY|nr:pyroglutamylated RFamide peptide receptor [Myotis myotis]
MQSLNITPEQFSRLLRDHNLTRRQFIARYGLRPLVSVPELPARAQLALVLAGALIFALALFGNTLVVYVVARSKAMRTVTNIFICSLALSDLLIAFFCIPVTTLQNVSDTWLGGAFVCKMVPFAQCTAVVTEILTLTCIAVERHQGLVHPLRAKCRYTNGRAFTTLGVVWLVAVIVGAPMWHVQRLEEEEAGCGHDGDRGGPLRRVLGSFPRGAHAGGIQQLRGGARRGHHQDDFCRRAIPGVRQHHLQPHRLRLYEQELQKELPGRRVLLRGEGNPVPRMAAAWALGDGHDAEASRAGPEGGHRGGDQGRGVQPRPHRGQAVRPAQGDTVAPLTAPLASWAGAAASGRGARGNSALIVNVTSPSEGKGL